MSQVAVITPPELLVDLELAKQHLGVDSGDYDVLIEAYIAAACATIDGPGGYLKSCIGAQTLELRLDGFSFDDWRHGGGYLWSGGWAGDAWRRWPSRRIELPFPPLLEVVSITYEDSTGTEQTLSPSGWGTTDDGVSPSFGTGWPFGRWEPDAVRIQYRAGYEATPPAIVPPVLMMVAGLFANREAQVIDARAVVAVNPTVQEALGLFQVRRV